MAYHNLLSKCDRALVAYLLSLEAGTADDVIPAKNSSDKPLPCTICFSRSATQEPPFSGVYKVKAQIDVKTGACVDVNVDEGKPKLDSDARVARTFDAFHLTNDSSNGQALAALLTQAAESAGVTDFTVLDTMVTETDAGTVVQQGGHFDVWIDTLFIEITCAPRSGL